MSLTARMVARSAGVALLAAAPMVMAQAPTGSPGPASPWVTRDDVMILPAKDNGQLAIVAYVAPANHQVVFGFRELPQRMNCAPSAVGKGRLYEIEGKRVPFRNECVGGTFTFVPDGMPATKSFNTLLGSTATLHVLTPSKFPYTFDVSSLAAVRSKLEAGAAK
jgi:hypothetical protein